MYAISSRLSDGEVIILSLYSGTQRDEKKRREEIKEDKEVKKTSLLAEVSGKGPGQSG